MTANILAPAAAGLTMPCISILQPWAWLITRPDLTTPDQRAAAAGAGLLKDIENRTWRTAFRGEILIHAGKTYSRAVHEDFAIDLLTEGIQLPRYEDMARGGIVGAARITDCVREHPSRWKMPDCWGFVLEQQRALPFKPLRGHLGIFRVPALDLWKDKEGSPCSPA